MKSLLLKTVDFLMARYVARYGVDTEDREAILMHLDQNVAKALDITIAPDVAGDYLRYLEGESK